MQWLHYKCNFNVAECPDDWVAYNAGQRCYKFKAVPTARYEVANAMCVVSIITSVAVFISRCQISMKSICKIRIDFLNGLLNFS